MIRHLLLLAALLTASIVPLASAPKPGRTLPVMISGEELGVGSWIWDKETSNRQRCRFWRSFEVPAGSKVTRARLRLTADNSYTVYLDG